MNITTTSFIPHQANVAEKSATREIEASKFKTVAHPERVAAGDAVSDEGREANGRVGVHLNAKA